MHKSLASARLDAAKGISADFNVVIVYEDLETGRHAKRVCDYLAGQLGHECALSQQMWKSDVLTVSKLREIAAKDATSADLIVISVHGTRELPAEIESWIDLWRKEHCRALALVALFEPPEVPASGAVRNHLANIARESHMAFFSHGISQSSPIPPAVVQENAGDRNRKAFSVLAGVLEEGAIPLHWGIND